MPDRGSAVKASVASAGVTTTKAVKFPLIVIFDHLASRSWFTLERLTPPCDNRSLPLIAIGGASVICCVRRQIPYQEWR